MAAATRSATADAPSAVKAEATSNTTDQQDKKSPPKPDGAASATKTEGGNEDSKSSAPGAHNSHFSLEPNPFEQSFGNPSAETPGKFGGLPSVASLTSPAPLGPGGTPGWQNSLRSGPLSPAMLAGPTNNGGGYFDSEFRGSFPTPNESSLRTGLTPGGGGSMFPAPSPNSQAIFNSMQTGGATPGTLDFHRTAMNAAARTKVDGTNGTSNAQGVKQEYQPAQQHASSQDPFSAASQPENDAVNSLYMLANNSNRGPNQFAVPGQPAHMASMHQRGKNGSQDTTGASGNKSAASDNGKKGSTAKASAASNGRRKADETPSKVPNAKRAKLDSPDDDDDDDDEDDDSPPPSTGGSKSKMTDEEKRKNFLERNRVAALKCRQRKKQWLANLQTKVEIFSSENDALTAQCAQMRDEIMHLKSILYAHKDCPISHQQGLGGNNMSNVIGNFDPSQNYLPMGGPNGQPMMAGQSAQGMQRN